MISNVHDTTHHKHTPIQGNEQTTSIMSKHADDTLRLTAISSLGRVCLYLILLVFILTLVTKIYKI